MLRRGQRGVVRVGRVVVEVIVAGGFDVCSGVVRGGF